MNMFQPGAFSGKLLITDLVSLIDLGLLILSVSLVWVLVGI